MRKRTLTGGLAVLLAVLLVIGLSVGPIMSQVEQTDYEVVSEADNIQIRNYPEMLVAQVQMQGEREQAIGEGFRVLADYIFGNNVAEQEIAMTAPVQQTSEKIAMTAPVLQQADSDGIAQQWQVRFVMPSKFTLQTIPKPVNDQVQLIKISEKTVAAIRFSGLNSNSNLQKHQAQLIEFLESKGIQPLSVPTYAFYNPPFTLPMFRRNEVMIEVQP